MTKPPLLSAEWSVLTDPSHVGVVRRQAASQVTAWELAELADTVSLLLSELLTNALKASSPTGEPVTARLSYAERTLEIAVSDMNDERPELSVPPVEQEGGRGLLVVATLSKDWGTRPNATGPGKTVWCTVAVPPPSSGPRTTHLHGMTHSATNSGLLYAVSRLAHLDPKKRALPVPALLRST
ncbi:ATP-binding protein [Streptomyces acidiscabies]|uniref:ATP-binding protein n=1 Tax=Streptomyces acidiscabies TaxID=42234 RepID=UPI0038F69849